LLSSLDDRGTYFYYDPLSCGLIAALKLVP
jgi:hypothetical protein